jgi:Glycosidases
MWWKDGIIYQIYPRSFKDSNNDGIGDLKGIIQKLDYLNDGTPESLGIDAIWISPFFRSPMKDFGYDISDYRDIDPIFGTLEDFRTLLEEAHKRSIHIIIDMVLNHTSDEHPWFQESRKDKTNPKADWYIWHPGKNGRPPNNWFSEFELKNAWWFDKGRGEFYLGTFTRNQPELNWRNPELRKEMFDLARYWLDMGVDGFRLDVINWFIKDEEFRSNPYTLKSVDFQKHLFDRNRPETIDICRELRKITDSYDERMMVGEVYTDDAGIASSYYGNGNDALHMTFNFNFLFQPWNADKIYKSIIKWYESLPGGAWPNFTFSNHDNLRHSYRYRAGKWTKARAKIAAALLMTLKGTPFIYYGEEIGMTGGKLRRKEMADPLSIRTWPLKRFCRDLARTPMQWDDTENADFSGVKPWLPVDSGFPENNIELQKSDKGSLFNFYRNLIWLRKAHPILQSGDISFLTEYLPDILAYMRNGTSEKILVILNFSDKKSSVNIKTLKNNSMGKSEGFDASVNVLFGSHRSTGEMLPMEKELAIEPYETIIFSL